MPEPARPPLTPSGYLLSMDVIAAAAQLVSGLQLKSMLATIEAADSIGPILYPGEYKHALHTGTLDQQKELIAAAIRMQAVLDAVVDAQDAKRDGATP